MSRNPKPTAEELRYVYDLILRGYGDADILAEYAALYGNGTLMFPYRVDERFVRERRKELETAREVLQGHLKVVDPIIIKQREKHFTELASIINCLLANDLDSVMAGGTITTGTASGEPRESSQVEYIVSSGSNFGNFDELTKEQLSVRLEQNIEFAIQEYTQWFFYNCFLPHLVSELPEEVRTIDYWTIVKEQPYQLIRTLRVLAARKTFKGTCLVCKDWQ